MRCNPGAILATFAVAALLVTTSVHADDAAPAASSDSSQSSSPDKAPTCDVPPHLLATDSALSKVADAVKNSQPLNILVVGSRSSTISASEASAYPARLQEMLKEKLPAVAVNVSVELRPKKTAEETAAELPKLMEDKKPTLVIWQTGTVDAMRSVDPDDFRSAVDQGVVALQKAGADVILMNLQYSPRTETMISASPYLDTMRVVAQQHDVPLFDRFSIMQQWNDSGEFDLFSAAHGLELAKRVHDCLGRALSTFVLDAARINTAQQN
jgi:lysophospholipase L1-like esterase